MKKKTAKRILIVSVIVVILLILFVPIPHGVMKDGGTAKYQALTYRIVVWNRFYDITNADGTVKETRTYTKTSVYWLPDNFKSIDELWEIEMKHNG